MPAFAALFTSLFASLASFFAAHMTKKTAFAAAAVATFAILTTAFAAAIAGAIAGIASIPTLPAWVQWGMAYFIPSSAPVAGGAIISAHVASAIYAWNCENLRLASYVT